MSTVFLPVGPTTLLTANTAGAQVTVFNTGAYDTQYLKIDNINNGNVDAFVNFGTANTTTATIANASSTGNSFIVQHNDTIYIATTGGFNQDPPNALYIAGITVSGTANVYITPIAIVS